MPSLRARARARSRAACSRAWRSLSFSAAFSARKASAPSCVSVITATFFPSAPSAEVSGLILAVENGVNQIGAMDVEYLAFRRPPRGED